MAKSKVKIYEMEDLSRMDTAEVRKAVQEIGKLANNRVYKFYKSQAPIFTSPAIKQLKESGGNIKTRGLSRNELLHEYKRAKTFIQSKTSTASGTKSWYKDLKKSFESKGIQVPGGYREMDKFLDAYDKLKDRAPEVSNVQFKYQVMQAIAEYQTEGYPLSEATEAIEDRLDDIITSSTPTDDFMPEQEENEWMPY